MCAHVRVTTHAAKDKDKTWSLVFTPVIGKMAHSTLTGHTSCQLKQCTQMSCLPGALPAPRSQMFPHASLQAAGCLMLALGPGQTPGLHREGLLLDPSPHVLHLHLPGCLDRGRVLLVGEHELQHMHARSLSDAAAPCSAGCALQGRRVPPLAASTMLALCCQASKPAGCDISLAVSRQLHSACEAGRTSRWCAPSGMTTATTESDRFWSTPPLLQGSSRPLLNTRLLSVGRSRPPHLSRQRLSWAAAS